MFQRTGEDGQLVMYDGARPGFSKGSSHGGASGRVLDDLRNRIISLDLPPGTALLRSELAQHYGVSQTPIRDSLRGLELEGLVEIYPQSKTIVTKIDLPKIHEAHFLRMAVEVEIARRLAIEYDSDLLAPAKSALRMQQALSGDVSQVAVFQELDETFHLALYRAIRQENMYYVIRARSGHLNRLRRLDPPGKEKINFIVRGHQSILDAIEARDPDAAVEAVRDHLGRTVQNLDDQRNRFRSYFS